MAKREATVSHELGHYGRTPHVTLTQIAGANITGRQPPSSRDRVPLVVSPPPTVGDSHLRFLFYFLKHRDESVIIQRICE